MEGGLSTPACLVGRLGLWGKADPGRLTLSEGIVGFTSDTRGLIFRAPLEEVSARFPKLYFCIGVVLTVGDKDYDLWFVPLQPIRGNESEGQTVGFFCRAPWKGAPKLYLFVAGNKFLLSDVRPARVHGRQWRAALWRPTRA
jgi:hypothetical protein